MLIISSVTIRIWNTGQQTLNDREEMFEVSL